MSRKSIRGALHAARRPHRPRHFHSRPPSDQLEIGYVPEHYCGPLHLAQSFFKSLLPSVSVKLVPFPKGTGHMITEFQNPDSTLDLALGLTESWVAAALSTPFDQQTYQLVGKWVKTPLRWAVVTGKEREDIQTIADLQKYNKVGVSRLGSGSHIMASVLAHEQGWSTAFQMKVLGAFPDLIRGVNGGEADFFMWEHFTTKLSWSGADAPLKRIGEISAPWPSWMLAARTAAFPDKEYHALDPVFSALDKGIAQFMGNEKDTIEILGTGELGCTYGEDDAREWMRGTEYYEGVKGIEKRILRHVGGTLRRARVLRGASVSDIAGIVLEDKIV